MGRRVILDEAARRKVAEAVESAERLSGGEIVTAVIPESDDYGFRELLFAVIVGFLSYNLMLALARSLEAFIGSLFWGFDPALLPFFFGFGSLIIGALAYALAQLPVVDRLIVPQRLRREAVKARAMRFFLESGACNTVDRTGILLFVSVLERRVELIADTGISAKVPAQRWEAIVSRLSAGIGAGTLTDSLVQAVTECGAILAEQIDRRVDDKDELDNGLHELGKGE